MKSVRMFFALVVATFFMFAAGFTFAQNQSNTEKQKQEEELFWKKIPVQTKVVKIGNGEYKVETKFQEAMWETPNPYNPSQPGMGYASREINNPGTELIGNIYFYFNGAVARVDKFLGVTRKTEIRSSSGKIESETDIITLKLGYPNLFGKKLDINTPEVEKFIDIVYDIDDNGKLSLLEIKKGNEKFSSFLEEKVNSLPSDQNFHVIRFTEDLGEFAKEFENFKAKPLQQSPQEKKLAELINYLVKNVKESNGHSLTFKNGIRIFITSGDEPDTGDIFTIQKGEMEFVDSGNDMYDLNENECKLDGKTDEIKFFSNEKKFKVRCKEYYSECTQTKKINEELQKEYETLVAEAYSQIFPR